MSNKTSTIVFAIFTTCEGNYCIEPFKNLRIAEDWKALTDRIAPGFIKEWKI